MTQFLRLLTLAAAVTFGGVFAATSSAHAACEAGKPGSELTGDEAQTVYDCLKDSLLAGYLEGDKRWIPAAYVADYRSWAAASTFPAAPGFHGERFLLTYVNAVGAEEYLKFEEEGVTMPAGTVIAKESFAVNDAGRAVPGPLFFMEKAAAGASPETDDWYYMMVAPDGTPQAVNVVEACHACHAGFDYRDSLGYPVEEARVK